MVTIVLSTKNNVSPRVSYLKLCCMVTDTSVQVQHDMAYRYGDIMSW